MTESTQTDETARCPTCGQRPVPDSKTMWTALTTKLTADAVNIATALSLIYLVVVLLTVVQNGRPDWGYWVYVPVAFLALVLVDLLAIVHHLMKLGFPFRKWHEPGAIDDLL